MRILRSSDYKRMPWKNGRGETVEIAAFPEGATVDTFDWRVSMATVTEDGPFSVFPGIDRTLSILAGEGMELMIESRAPVLLKLISDPYPFPADTRTSARLVDGAITDLNVMTRRGRFTHVVEQHARPLSIEPSDAVRLVFCRTGRLTAEACNRTIALGALDSVLLEQGEVLAISDARSFYVATFTRDAPHFV